MTQDWDIPPRGEQCATCQTPFADNQPLTSALTFGAEGYARADYCTGCWKPELAEGSAFSIWRGVFRLPPPTREPVLRKENAESLLRTLMEEGDGSKTGVIYILAVMLERKRTLIERQVRKREDGVLMRIYEHRKTGETFVIADPELGMHELEPVQIAVAEILGGLQKTAPAPATTEAPATPPTPTPTAGDPATKPPAGFQDGFYSRQP